MTRDETKDILQIISLYRPYFTTTYKDNMSELTNEWYDKLKEYDYKDVKDNLDNFMRDESSRIPTPYDLIRETRTTRQKSIKGKTFIYCDVCNKPLEIFIDEEKKTMDRRDANKHIDRCHSIRYLQTVYRRYLKREIQEEDIKALKKMEKREFDETYDKIVEKIYPLIPDGALEKESTRMYLESRKNEN